MHKGKQKHGIAGISRLDSLVQLGRKCPDSCYEYVYAHIRIYIYIYIYAHPSPPMLHTKLLFLSSGSWEVGSLGCENIGRDQISPKFLKPEMRKHRQGSNFPKIPKI